MLKELDDKETMAVSMRMLKKKKMEEKSILYTVEKRMMMIPKTLMLKMSMNNT